MRAISLAVCCGTSTFPSIGLERVFIIILRVCDGRERKQLAPMVDHVARVRMSGHLTRYH
jgi:hypothetical protein